MTRNAVPWWTNELTNLKSKTNRAKKQAIRAKKLKLVDINDYVSEYKKLRNNYVKQINKQKTAAWQNFVTTVGNEDPWSIVYKIVRDKIKKHDCIGSLTLPNGQQTNNWTETMNALLDKCVPIDDKELENKIHLKIKQQNNKYRNCNIEPDISQDEITTAMCCGSV